MNIKKGIILGLITLFLASCSASKKAPRKCDGRKGVKTRMGTM
ncbi:MAG: hypothetical protein N4A35_11050 [Flavobacteriales bacterium]|jgi:hypothetical protein|nr:hypothetical protein [Flavobacteriales bacterium]